MSPLHSVEVNQVCEALERLDPSSIRTITLWLMDCASCEHPCPQEQVRTGRPPAPLSGKALPCALPKPAVPLPPPVYDD